MAEMGVWICPKNNPNVVEMIECEPTEHIVIEGLETSGGTNSLTQTV